MPSNFAARQWRIVAAFGWCRELNAGRKKRRVFLSEERNQIMSERMIPGGVLRFDATRFGHRPKGLIRNAYYWRSSIQECGLRAKMSSPACLRKHASLENRGRMAHDENEVTKKGGFTEVEESRHHWVLLRPLWIVP